MNSRLLVFPFIVQKNVCEIGLAYCTHLTVHMHHPDLRDPCAVLGSGVVFMQSICDSMWVP